MQFRIPEGEGPAATGAGRPRSHGQPLSEVTALDRDTSYGALMTVYALMKKSSTPQTQSSGDSARATAGTASGGEASTATVDARPESVVSGTTTLTSLSSGMRAKAAAVGSASVPATSQAKGLTNKVAAEAAVVAVESAAAVEKDSTSLPLSSSSSASTQSSDDSFEWSDSLHLRFLMAIFDFAIRKASPKKIMKMMKGAYPSTLTTEHVKSHLQKFRNNCGKTRDIQVSACDEIVRASYSSSAAGGQRVNVHDMEGTTWREKTRTRHAFGSYPLLQSLLDIAVNGSGRTSKSKTRKTRKTAAAGGTSREKDATREGPTVAAAPVVPMSLAESARRQMAREMQEQMRLHHEMMQSHAHQILRYSYAAQMQDLIPDSQAAGDTRPGQRRSRPHDSVENNSRKRRMLKRPGGEAHALIAAAGGAEPRSPYLSSIPHHQANKQTSSVIDALGALQDLRGSTSGTMPDVSSSVFPSATTASGPFARRSRVGSANFILGGDGGSRGGAGNGEFLEDFFTHG